MRTTHRLTAGVLAAFLGTGLIAAPLAASADGRDNRNAAIALGALSAGLLLTQHNKTPGIIAGVGALIAASQSGDRRDCNDYGYNGGGYVTVYNGEYRGGRDDGGRYNRNDRQDRGGDSRGGHESHGRR
jgi:hypothetical protein